MTNFSDDLFFGTLSRRRLFERLAAVGLTAPLAASSAQAPQAQPKSTGEPQEENLVFSPANIGGGGRVERNFYRDWIKKSKAPTTEGYAILDAKRQELQPWPEIGGRGLYLNFPGNVHMDAVLLEAPAGKALLPRRHFYEQIVYAVAGRGYTTFGEGRQQIKVDWSEGSLFAVPMNVLHRHHNADSQHPARLLAITSFPLALQIFGSLGLIQDSNFSFSDRYAGQPDFFTSGKRVRQRWDRANYVRDIRSNELVMWEERGQGNASLFWEMAGNTVLEPHVSEFPVGSYKLGHRHPYEAVILTLNGAGFSLYGKDGLRGSDAMKLDWQAGSIISPPYFWYHQHFNTGNDRARYLALTEGDFPKRLGIPLDVEQIETSQEDPGIRKLFDREVQRRKSAHHHGGRRGHHHA